MSPLSRPSRPHLPNLSNLVKTVKHLALLLATFVAEVATLLATVLTFAAVHPAYAAQSQTPKTAEIAETVQVDALNEEVDALVRAIDNGGISSVDASWWDPGQTWVSPEVTDRIESLKQKSSTSKRLGSLVKKIVHEKVREQLGTRNGVVWKMLSTWANW